MVARGSALRCPDDSILSVSCFSDNMVTGVGNHAFYLIRFPEPEGFGVCNREVG